MQITANTAGLAKGVSTTEKLLGNLGRAAGNVDKLFGTSFAASAASVGESLTALGISVPGAVAGFTALAAAGGATIAYLVSTADQVERLTFAADKLGASFDFVQVLDEAARRSGSSIDELGSTFNKLLVRIDAASTGSEKAQKAFDRVGISVDSLKTLSPEQVFRQTAEALVGIQDPAARAAAAVAIFGKTGADLLPTLRGFAEAERDIERFGARISGLDAQRLLQVDSSLESLGTSVTGVLRSLTFPFAGLLSGISSGAAEVIGGLNKIIVPLKDALGTPVFDAIGKELFLTARIAGDFFGFIGDGLKSLTDWAGLSPASIDSVDKATESAGRLAAGADAARKKLEQMLDPETIGAQLLKEEMAGAAKVVLDLQRNLANQADAGVAAVFKQFRADEEARAQGIRDQLDGLLNQARIQQQIAAFDDQAARQQREDFAAAFAARQQEVADENNRIAEERRTLEERLASRTAEIRAARGAEFSRRSDQPLRVQDVRRGGIDDVLRFLSGRQDPAVSEAAKQTTELKAIKAAIDSLRAEPVTILGAA